MSDTSPHIADVRRGVQRFRKRPLEIEAIQLCWANWNAVCDFVGDSINPSNPGWNITAKQASDTCGEPGPEYIAISVLTTHGDRATVRHGDWIVPDSKPGTFYPVKPDVMDATYDRIEDQP